ncbi:mechanosensitive ion channel [Methylicorpusculum oleiharenae]|uniref:mechanosensitive ion channel domain-containing protein n=1 Tax=Methylicorpusculum oleiharenae TaxID=1338687 RepID=UPI001356F85E|nr:mechanosensitive ion channel domain-containing protein [Methylicorpusculum oleiharenae]MCD2452268.1 mechanosensitive ion channel [Methylicorpusculum oleiharenae]
MNNLNSNKLRADPRNAIQTGLTSRVSVRLVVVVCLTLLIPYAWGAGDSAVRKGVDATGDERIASIKSRLAQIQSHLSTLAADGLAAPPEADGDEWSEYKRLLNLIANTYETHLDALNKLNAVRIARQDFNQQASAWLGFPDPGPYSVDFVDDLWKQLRAKEREIEAVRIEQAMYASLLESRRLALRSSEQALRKAQEQLEAALPAAADRLRWYRDLSALRNQFDQARVASIDTERELRDEMLSLRSGQNELLLRQVRTASLVSPLSEQDRDAKLAVLTQLQFELDKETQQAIESDRMLQKQWHQTSERIREAEAFSSALLPEVAEQQKHNIERLKSALSTQVIEAEASSSTLKVMRLLGRIVVARRHLWETRYRIENDSDPKTLEDALDEINKGHDQLILWQQFFLSSFNKTRSLLDNQEKKLADWKPEYGDRELAERERLAYSLQESVLRRIAGEVDELDAMLRSLKQSVQLRYEGITLSERLNELYINVGGLVGNLWDFELFTVADKIVAEGREIVSQRSVTVGKIVRMLLILGIGLWLVARIADCGNQLMLKYLPGRESGILLSLRLFTLFAVIAIVVYALVRVHIPLTVFTFFGGALAIGIGFGAQNIINNFISGLILLVERPIKLGDIVDVEGVRGTITHIGSRCCQVHCFDGIDMLIPNSSFLEKSVTNWTLSDQSIRCSITVGIAYGSSVREALLLVGQAAGEHGLVLKSPAPEVYLEEFGNDALNLTLDFWVGNLKQINRRRVMSDIRHRIVKLFNERGIEIAFPQRDIHLDSSKPFKVELVKSENETPSKLKCTIDRTEA